MKKSVLILCVISCFAALFFVIRNNRSVNTIQKESFSNESQTDYDGKMEEQNFEILKTKDINLGYVPKNVLIREYQKLAKFRSSFQNKRSPQTNSLVWTERGPYADVAGPSDENRRPANAVCAGRVRAMWVDFSDPTHKTVWAGGIDGGLWKNTDITANPSRWTMVNDFFTNLGVSAICQDPVNANIMYFGTGEKTVNADQVKGGGIWKSIDNGVSWNLLNNTTGFWNASKMLCDNKGNLYVATIGNGMGLQRSNDGGNTWVNITPSGLNVAITDLEISSTGRMHIICGYNGSTNSTPSGYRFTDNPETVISSTWSTPSTILPNTTYNVDIAVSGNTVYALPSNSSYQTPQVYKSIDGGLNWATTTTSPPITGLYPLSNGQAWYDIALAVDQTNPNNVIAGGLNCYSSNDGGKTWVNCSKWYATSGNFIHADQHAALWNGAEILMVTDGGIFYSPDNGVTFTNKNSGLRIKQFYSCAIHPTSTNYFLAGAQDNGTHQFVSPGLGNTTELTGGDGGFVHIDQDEPDFQFGSYVFNNYRVSNDGGQSWSQVNFNNSGLFINPTDYDSYANKMYCGDSVGKFGRWEDPQTGSTFSEINLSTFSGNKVTAVKVSPYSPNTVFFGSTNGAIVKVTNSDQKNITEKYIGTAGMAGRYISNIEIGTTENTLITSISNSGSTHVWTTINGGNTWTDISGNLPNIPVRWAMFYPDDDTKAIIATEFGIYETDLINGSSTVWVNNLSFPIVRTDMLQYRQSDGLIAAATHGRGLFTAVIPKTIPYIRFSSPFTIKSEAGNATVGCRKYHDYQIPLTIDIPPAGDATITVSALASSSATLGVDYDFTTNNDFVKPSNTLQFLNGSLSSKSLTMRIYDDGEVEPDEMVSLSFTVTGTTNAKSAPSGVFYSFIIKDNDSVPLPPAVPLGPSDANISNETPFKSTNSKYRLQCIYSSSELYAMGIKVASDFNSISLNVLSKGSTKPFNSFTVQLTNTNISSLQTGFVNTPMQQVFSGNYTTSLGSNGINFTSPFSWDGRSNILIQYCFDNTAFAADNKPDIVEGANDPLFGSYCALYSNPVAASGSACLLTSSSVSILRPKISFGLTSGHPIETLSNNPSIIYIGSANEFYSLNNAGNILSYFKSIGSPLGCINTNISESGAIWQPFNGGQRSQKVFDINGNNGNQPYKTGLYFSAKELGGFLPSNIKLATTSAAVGAQANSSNSVELSTTYKTYGDGFVFFTNVDKYQRFFLVNNLVTLPLTLVSFNAQKQTDIVKLTWQTKKEEQISHFNIEKSLDGKQFQSIGIVKAKGNAIQSDYFFTDKDISNLNYYRLKIYDNSGKYIYSKIVLVQDNPSMNNLIISNPFSSAIHVNFKTPPQTDIILQLLNMQGKMISQKSFKRSNTLDWNLNEAVLPIGIYILKLYFDNNIVSKKLLKK